MWFIWGPTSDVKDIGIVAERCPHCGRVSPCRIAARSQGLHLYFIPLVSGLTDAVCSCGACGGQFRCELWQYRDPIPEIEASTITIESLLERTNPNLKERLAWEQQLDDHGSNPQFSAAVRSVEQLRPGAMRRALMSDLLRWGQLDDRQRGSLVLDADQLARSLQFARAVATQLPSAAGGCLLALFICLAVWSAFLWAPAVQNLLWGGVTLFAGAAAGASIWQAILTRRVRRWTSEVLVPESQKAGVELRRFLDILRELPAPSPHSVDELRHLKEEEETIREELRKLGETD